MTECTCKLTATITQLTVKAAIEVGFFVLDRTHGEYDRGTDLRRDGVVFAGTLDQCLGYVRDKMGATP